MDEEVYISMLEGAIFAIEDLISESHGVYGLHLNGEIAQWGDLLSGGKYEDWMIEFDSALEAIKEKRGLL